MMEARFLLTKRGCNFCKNAIKVINKLNPKLPLDRRIRIVDCLNEEEFGVKSIPLVEVLYGLGLNKGFPFLYIDGIEIDVAPTPEILKRLLSSMLKEEFVY